MKKSKALTYIEGVLSGDIVTSKLVLLAIERHNRDLVDGHIRGLKFDKAKGNRVIQFVEAFCNHSQGEWDGQPFILEGWQAALLYILYGWTWAETGYRRFRYAYVELAKGNGKSALASCLGLFELIGQGEPGAEVYSVATKKDQARIVFNEAERMVKQSPSLRSRVSNNRDCLFIKGTASKFQPLSSDEDSLDGPRPQCLIVDELHAWGSPGRKLWDVLANALGKRRSPIFFAITTAGSDRQSICWQQHEYSEKVLSGIFVDDTWFAWICGMDDGDDWEDSRNWVKANPNLGTSVRMDELQAVVTKAKGDPASLNGVLRLRLGVWTQSHTAWLPMDKWDLCNGAVDPVLLKGRPCYAGLDLSTTTDISALVLLFPPHGDDDKWRVLPNFFLPSENVEKREKKDRVPYGTWSRQGLFNLTGGNVIDYDVIREKIKALGLIYNIKEIAFDRWNAQQICTQLETDGFVMVPFGQGYVSISAPSKRLMELVLGADLATGGNPIMRWMASNTMVTLDPAGNIKPDKSKSTEKIDGIVALIMALGRASVSGPAKRTASEIYEERPVRVF
jgi:phage terminase large subunit-like protein